MAPHPQSIPHAMAEQIYAVDPARPGGVRHERYLLCSGVRSGLKREFVFALRAQAELSPLGRTRSGKVRRLSSSVSPSGGSGSVGRRVKRSGVGGSKDILVFGGGSDVPLGDAGEAEKLRALDERESTLVRMCSYSVDKGASVSPNLTRERKVTLLISAEQREEQEGFGNMGVTVTPVSDEEEACLEKEIAVDGQNELVETVLDGQNELVETVLPIDCQEGIGRDEMEIENAVAIYGKKGAVNGGQSEMLETAVPVDCRYETIVESFDNNQNELDVENAVSILSAVVASGSGNGVELEDGEDDLKAEIVIAVDCQDELKVENGIVMDGKNELKVKIAMDVDRESEMKVKSAAAIDGWNTPKVVSATAVNCKTELKVNNTIDVGDRSERTEMKKPIRRFTRSLLKSLESSAEVSPVTSLKDISKSHDTIAVNDQEVVKVEPVKPFRRFTRSLLKSMEDEKDIKAALASTPGEGSDGFHQVQDPDANMGNGASRPPGTTPKKKMELKMSKKIVLTKVPANVRELIATGFLDGLVVKYATSGKKKGVLHGVINDGGILCSCSSCKGRNTVSAYQFEVHAGSNKKHPANFITLENGSSLHDVIKACSSSPLDMLESTIKNAAGSDAKHLAVSCQQCKASFQSSHIGKLPSVCDACLVETERLASNKSSASSIATKKISSSRNMSSQKKSAPGRMTTKDFWLHKLVFMNNTLPEGTEVAYYTRGQRLLEGYIKGSGIFCCCCNSVVSPSQFEAHAGCAQRKKPYLNIYTSNGVSLHELSVSLSKDKTFSARENDDLCRICAGDGDLLLCDSCPRSFHKECVGLSTIPKGNWYCPCCESMIQREKYVAHNENAIAAGRISGVDPIEQIFKRCIRIVQTPEIDASSCVLCRCHDFSKSGFGPRTVLLCDQCEKEFHIGCLKSHNIADLEELPEGEWFCCSDCGIVYLELRKFVLSGIQKLPELLLDVIKSKDKEKCPTNGLDLDVRWQFLNGKMASSDSRLLLSRAVSIFQESFDPIVDLPTGQDLIPSMVYGRDIGHQDFGGMYCAILTVNTSVVSVGLLRVLGRDVAELPLVATTKESQGHGYFQALFSCIEALLESLDVKHLVLPATKEAEEIWIKKFGFCEITHSQLEEYTKGSRPMSFRGTLMLHKLVPKSKIFSVVKRKKERR